MNPVCPSRIQRRLMWLISPRHLRNELLGDMEEEFHGIASRVSPAAASRWYRRQLVRSAGPLLGQRLRACRPELVTLGAFLGYWAFYCCELMAMRALAAVSQSGIDSTFVARNLLLVLGIEVLALAAAGIAIGLVVGLAKSARHVQALATVALTATFVVPTVINTFRYPDAVPIELRIAFALLAFPLIATGAALGRRFSNR